jgi:allantoicase|nr:allantoicase [Kofleriaceae bacterium]
MTIKFEDDLPDLAGEDVGGAAIACNDEFFAEKENLLRSHAAVWKDHLYTDRGKWMDGWETRRRRAPEFVGHPSPDGDRDWCVVRLGMPGKIRGVVVDTAWFRGNFPESARVLAAEITSPLDLRELGLYSAPPSGGAARPGEAGPCDAAAWVEIVPRSPLAGDAKNRFEVAVDRRFTHVKLEIFPDGGVARLRVHGEVATALPAGELVDLAALDRGAWVEACSDMFFGSRNNLIKPERSRSMADGWETRRRRGPGNDWALIRLAATGTIERLEIDTSHFKGNAPARCVISDADGGRELLATPLQPHTRHVFADELRRIGPVGRLRVSTFPCGGIARLRAYGYVAATAPALRALAALADAERTAALLRCCGSTAWATALAKRAYDDEPALLRGAESLWWSLGERDHLEAFAAHPRLGEAAPVSAWSSTEQRGMAAAADATRAALADANRAYGERHGFVFLLCATGRSADDMLAAIRARLGNDRATELRIAAEEQAKILRLRLRKLLQELTP